jgi:uncharacterized protein (TIGR02118 family)
MVHVTVSYPNADGTTFDHDYYLNKHLPLVRSRLGAAVKRAEVDRAIGGPEGSAPAWMASGHLFFDSLDAFQNSFGPHAEEILADIPNFTNVQPHLVISESVSA